MSRICFAAWIACCAIWAQHAPPLKTDDRILLYEKRIASDPNNIRNQTQLAAAYIQKTRETTDYSYLDRAAKILEKVLESDRRNYEALRLRNLIELNRHNFAKVAEYAREMAELAPGDPQNWGTLGDAFMEMGQYDSAKEAYDKMVSLRPNLFSYNRVAYYRFVTGDAAGAISSMQQAVASGNAIAENRAWCLGELGNMYFKLGKLAEAERSYTEALETFPAMHSAQAGMGSVLAAQGKFAAAIESYRRAQAAVPMLPYAAALYDLYRLEGKKEEARKQLQLIDTVARLEEAAEQKANRTLALIYANQDRNLERALELARADLAVRKDVYTWDALAWVLYKKKQYQEAREASLEALKMSTPEPQFHYHAGMIAYALGDRQTAKRELKAALSLNAQFDLGQAAVARQTYQQLAD